MWISNVATFAPTLQNRASVMLLLAIYRGADKSLARPDCKNH